MCLIRNDMICISLVDFLVSAGRCPDIETPTNNQLLSCYHLSREHTIPPRSAHIGVAFELSGLGLAHAKAKLSPKRKDVLVYPAFSSTGRWGAQGLSY